MYLFRPRLVYIHILRLGKLACKPILRYPPLININHTSKSLLSSKVQNQLNLPVDWGSHNPSKISGANSDTADLPTTPSTELQTNQICTTNRSQHPWAMLRNAEDMLKCETIVQVKCQNSIYIYIYIYSRHIIASSLFQKLVPWRILPSKIGVRNDFITSAKQGLSYPTP